MSVGAARAFLRLALAERARARGALPQPEWHAHARDEQPHQRHADGRGRPDWRAPGQRGLQTLALQLLAREAHDGTASRDLCGEERWRAEESKPSPRGER